MSDLKPFVWPGHHLRIAVGSCPGGVPNTCISVTPTYLLQENFGVGLPTASSWAFVRDSMRQKFQNAMAEIQMAEIAYAASVSSDDDSFAEAPTDATTAKEES